jgi:hypothetical protein
MKPGRTRMVVVVVVVVVMSLGLSICNYLCLAFENF